MRSHQPKTRKKFKNLRRRSVNKKTSSMRWLWRASRWAKCSKINRPRMPNIVNWSKSIRIYSRSRTRLGDIYNNTNKSRKSTTRAWGRWARWAPCSMIRPLKTKQKEQSLQKTTVSHRLPKIKFIKSSLVSTFNHRKRAVEGCMVTIKQVLNHQIKSLWPRDDMI